MAARPLSRRQQIISLTRAGEDKALSINEMCDLSYTRFFRCIPGGKRKSVVESVELLAAAMRGMRKENECECGKRKG